MCFKYIIHKSQRSNFIPYSCHIYKWMVKLVHCAHILTGKILSQANKWKACKMWVKTICTHPQQITTEHKPDISWLLRVYWYNKKKSPYKVLEWDKIYTGNVKTWVFRLRSPGYIFMCMVGPKSVPNVKFVYGILGCAAVTPTAGMPKDTQLVLRNGIRCIWFNVNSSMDN